MDSDLRNLIAASRPSVVLSQARASLLNPSRPCTPIQSSRRLNNDVESPNGKSGLRRTYFPDHRMEDDHAVEVKLAKRKEKELAEKKKPKVHRNVNAKDPRPYTPQHQQLLEQQQQSKPKARCEEKEGENGLLGENTAKGVMKNVEEKVSLLRQMSKQRLKSEILEFWDSIDQLCSFLDNDSLSISDDIERVRWFALSEMKKICKNTENETVVIVHACKLCIRLARCSTKRSTRADQTLEEICEVIYSLASEKDCDDLFRSEKLLEVMVMHLLPSVNAASKQVPYMETPSQRRYLIFALGSLKFISTENVANQKELTQNGLIGRLANLTSAILDIGAKGDVKANEVSAQILIQATALLRSVVDDKRRIQQFWNANIVEKLCSCLVVFSTERELSFNCVRVLSKLSMTTKGRNAVDILPLMQALKLHYRKGVSLSIRVCFILGNLTSDDGLNRKILAGDDFSGVKVLLEVFTYHASRYIDRTSTESPSSRKRKNIRDLEDLLVKLIRLIANISIDEDIGAFTSGTEGIELISDVLETASKKMDTLAEASDTGTPSSQATNLFRVEELALNAVACITNLSFYEDESHSFLQSEATVQLLLPFLFSENIEAAMEAIRAFGNFSRNKQMHECIAQHRVDEAMLILLDHVDRSVVLGACGVLTNLVSCENTRGLLRELDGMNKLVSILRKTGVYDPELSLRICMVLHNFGLSSRSTNDGGISLKTRKLLHRTLDELVEVAIEINEEGKDEEDVQYLGDFIEVAQKILAQVTKHIVKK